MFCNDFVSVSLIVKKKAKTVKQSGCGLASVLKKMGISNIISDDIFGWKQKWSTGMKAWKEKRKIIYIIEIILLLLYAYFALNYSREIDSIFLKTILQFSRHLIHIGLILCWIVSIQQRILHTAVRRCLLSVGMLLVQYAGRADHYRISEKWKYICVPAFILLMLVFTNDIHQQVFRFPYGFAVQKGIILMDRDII